MSGDGAVVGFDYLFAYGQTESGASRGPAAGCIHAIEMIEEFSQVFGAHAGRGILEIDGYPAGFASKANDQLAALSLYFREFPKRLEKSCCRCSRSAKTFDRLFFGISVARAMPLRVNSVR